MVKRPVLFGLIVQEETKGFVRDGCKRLRREGSAAGDFFIWP